MRGFNNNNRHSAWGFHPPTRYFEDQLACANERLSLPVITEQMIIDRNRAERELREHLENPK